MCLVSRTAYRVVRSTQHAVRSTMTNQTGVRNLFDRLRQNARQPKPLLLLLLGLVLILSYAFFIRSFLDQRQAQTNMAAELSDARNLLATVQPADLEDEVARLRADLSDAQHRLVSAQADLPGTSENVSLIDRILQAGTDSGVDITLFRAIEPAGTETIAGETFNVLTYQVRAEGDMDSLITFATRLENELAVGAQLTDTSLNARGDGYRFDAHVHIRTSTIARAGLPAQRPTPGNEERIASLRAEYAQAMEDGDFELALSLLIRLKARQPESTEIDKLFYDTYVRYGEALLASGAPGPAEEQFLNALAIEPDGDEAVLGLLKVKAAITATPRGTVTPGGPPVAVTPSPTLPVIAQASATAIPSPTWPTATRGPSRTPTRTYTPRATSTATATPSPYEFVVTGEPSYLPNCGLTSIQGYFKDETNRPMEGVRVKVWWDGAPADLPLAKASGTDPTKPSGYYDYTLAPYPKAGKWYAAVFDEERGWEISPRLTVFTDAEDCNDRGAGHQVVVINWQRAKGTVGQWQPTSTATLVGSATPRPTNTPAPTRTPTISPTPTLEPHSYPRDETPDLDIPDFPNGPAVSVLSVGDDFDLRDIRVLIYITHDDIRDLVVTLVSPSSTRIELYRAVPNETQRTEVRSWFTTSTNTALKNLIDQPALGNWNLEVLDEVEGRTGVLQSWTLELYP